MRHIHAEAARLARRRFVRDAEAAVQHAADHRRPHLLLGLWHLVCSVARHVKLGEPRDLGRAKHAELDVRYFGLAHVFIALHLALLARGYGRHAGPPRAAAGGAFLSVAGEAPVFFFESADVLH